MQKKNLIVLYLLFDFNHSNSISLDELVIVFNCVIRGYCKVTKSKIPKYSELEKYAKLVYYYYV